jgi:hypothetical protein
VATTLVHAGLVVRARRVFQLPRPHEGDQSSVEQQGGSDHVAWLDNGRVYQHLFDHTLPSPTGSKPDQSEFKLVAHD